MLEQKSTPVTHIASGKGCSLAALGSWSLFTRANGASPGQLQEQFMMASTGSQPASLDSLWRDNLNSCSGF